MIPTGHQPIGGRERRREDGSVMQCARRKNRNPGYAALLDAAARTHIMKQGSGSRTESCEAPCVTILIKKQRQAILNALINTESSDLLCADAFSLI